MVLQEELFMQANNMTPEDFINQTNQYRVANKLAPLKLDSRLQKAAEGRAAYIGQSNNFSHQGPLGMDYASFMVKSGYGKSGDKGTYLENLAAQFPDATSTMQAWQKSPMHNANLLNPRVKDIGVAIVPGKNYVIQLFGTSQPSTLTPIKPSVAKPTTKITPQQNTILNTPKSQLQNIDFSKLQMKK